MTRATLVLIAALLGAPAGAQDWWSVPGPSPGPPRVHGSYARGCIAGAVTLPADGEGYQAMRLLRSRTFGHPQLIDYVQGLARRVSRERLGSLLVGDLAQARGGPMRSGHRSHQTGLDVDVWFRPAPPERLSAEARESLSAWSVVAADGASLERGRWSGDVVRVLRLAAADPRVGRIFVNAAIKRELCRRGDGDRAWLRKLRPWWGHDDHFHVRLACPADSPGCTDQDPVPDGDGCDATLDWWLSAEAKAELERLRTLPPTPPPSLDELPAACRSVLEAR